MRYEIEKVMLCEVRVWGYVEAESMYEAMGMAEIIGTGASHDHEIISDIKTIAAKIKEME